MAAFSGASGSEALQAGFKGAFSGAVFGGIGGAFGDTWNASRVAVNGVAGGITSEINGGDFKSGALLSLSTSLARFYYNRTLGYDVDAKGGDKLASPSGRYDEVYGVPEDGIVFGTNTKDLVYTGKNGAILKLISGSREGLYLELPILFPV